MRSLRLTGSARRRGRVLFLILRAQAVLLLFSPLLPAAGREEPDAAKISAMLKEEIRSNLFLLKSVEEGKVSISSATALELADHLNYCLLESGNILGREKTAKIRTGDALLKLSHLRSALRAYYAKNLRYPQTLLDLVPEYIKELPELYLGGTPFSGITEINDGKTEIENAVSDSGGWIYFASPASPDYGLVAIDSRMKDESGIPLWKK